MNLFFSRTVALSLALSFLACALPDVSSTETTEDFRDVALNVDGAILDADFVDVNVFPFDAGGLDANASDAHSLDVQSPDVNGPDASAPDASAPDASAPDASAPDVNAPDVNAPDVSRPDVVIDPVVITFASPLISKFLSFFPRSFGCRHKILTPLAVTRIPSPSACKMRPFPTSLIAKVQTPLRSFG